MREKGSGTYDAVDEALRQYGIKTRDLIVSTTMSSSEAVKQAVLADCGVAFVSEMAVREDLKQGELVAIKLSELTITRRFSVIYKKGKTLSPAAEALYQCLGQVKA
jgi:DNA-binding transcriptional LysR family regulator